MRASAERGVFAGLVVVGSLLAPVSTAQAQAPKAEPTFTKDVLPILQRSCQKCHRPGTSAPMSLLTYQEVRPWVRVDHARRSRRARCRPGTSTAASASTSTIPSLSDDEIAHDRRVGRQRRAAGPRRRCAAAEAVRGRRRVDLRRARPDRAHGEGIQDSRERPGLHAGRGRRPGHHRRSLREVGADHSRRRSAPSTTRTCTSMRPRAPTRDGLGLGMGSNIGNEVDLIEYGAGNDADIFPDGTTKMIKAGSKFRFSSHYHPYGEETFDRQRVGIKFYPEGRRAEVRRHLAPHPHRRRQRLGAESRARSRT